MAKFVMRKEKTISGESKYTVIKSRKGSPFGIRQGVFNTKRQAQSALKRLRR